MRNNTTHTTQHNADSAAIECIVRVKGGDLIPKGKGTFTIGMTPDQKIDLNMILPSESDTSVPLDLTSIDRLELVSTASEIYRGKRWIGPAVATAAAFLRIPKLLTAFFSMARTYVNTDIMRGVVVGSPYVAGLYAGSKLNRTARFVGVASDGRYCVAEMPQGAFHFLQGIQAGAATGSNADALIGLKDVGKKNAMSNTAHTTPYNTVATIECVIRVKAGNLAPKGKGTLTIGMIPDQNVTLSATLPNESGAPEPFDLLSLEQLELVSTGSGIYHGKQWIGPAAATATAFVGVPVLIDTIVPIEYVYAANPNIMYGILIGSPYVAGLYAGSTLNRIVRFVIVMNDGRHCVAEMPEAAFGFLQGVKATENLHIGRPDISTERVETAPVPA